MRICVSFKLCYVSFKKTSKHPFWTSTRPPIAPNAPLQLVKFRSKCNNGKSKVKRNENLYSDYVDDDRMKTKSDALNPERKHLVWNVIPCLKERKIKVHRNVWTMRCIATSVIWLEFTNYFSIRCYYAAHQMYKKPISDFCKIFIKLRRLFRNIIQKKTFHISMLRAIL